jgi:hypothetical protein
MIRGMSERVDGLLVTFEDSTKREYLEHFINTVRFMRGVASVTEVPEHPAKWMVLAQRDKQWTDALLNLVRTGLDPTP